MLSHFFSMKRSSNTFMFRSIAYTLATAWLIPVLLLCFCEAIPRHDQPGSRLERSQLHGAVQSVVEPDEEERVHKESSDAPTLFCLSVVDFGFVVRASRVKAGLLNAQADWHPPLFRLHCSLII